MYLVVILIFLLNWSFAKNYDRQLDYYNIKSMPQTRTKDFFTLLYLQDHNNKSQQRRLRLFLEAKRPMTSHWKALIKKDKSFNNIKNCIQAKTFSNLSIACLDFRFSSSQILKMSRKNQVMIAKKLQLANPQKARIARIASTSKILSNLTMSELMIFFLHLPHWRFEKIFKNYLTEAKIIELAKAKGFSKFLERMAMRNLDYSFYKRFLKVNYKNLDAFSAWYLALMAIKSNKKQKALKFLKIAANKSYISAYKSRALFWLYQLNKDELYLSKIIDSKGFDIYSLYAREKLNKQFNNIVYKLPAPKHKGKYLSSLESEQFYNHFLYSKNIDPKLIAKYDYQKLLPLKALLMNKNNAYQALYFLSPYNQYLNKASASEKALIYAIQKQESLHIPGLLSFAYAMGLMQIMPFLSRDIAKEKGYKNFHILQMFEPKINLEFGLHHLRWLKKNVQHPLFIAYAYNAGFGFLKRNLKKKKLFSNRAYEPFLSMELLPYRETRNYGKKVLANYYIYAKRYNLDLSLDQLLDIKNPYL